MCQHMKVKRFGPQSLCHPRLAPLWKAGGRTPTTAAKQNDGYYLTLCLSLLSVGKYLPNLGYLTDL